MMKKEYLNVSKCSIGCFSFNWRSVNNRRLTRPTIRGIITSGLNPLSPKPLRLTTTPPNPVTTRITDKISSLGWVNSVTLIKNDSPATAMRTKKISTITKNQCQSIKPMTIKLAFEVVRDRATTANAGIKTVAAWVSPVPMKKVPRSLTSRLLKRSIWIRGSFALFSTFQRTGSSTMATNKNGRTSTDDKLDSTLVVLIWLTP